MATAGRRPGPTETPAAILAAARDAFAARGYQGASIRAIAAAAGVNPALVHHYFGTKDDLFVAAMDLPFNPAEMIMELLAAGPREEFAERFVRAFVQIWRDPEAGPRLQALLRSAVAGEDGAALVRNLAENVLLVRASEALGVPKIQVAAAMTHLIGLMLGAMIIRVEPLASADEYQLVELVTPAISRYLAP